LFVCENIGNFLPHVITEAFNFTDPIF
jgi:hypothetical protein